ncbi:transposase [Microcoleus anatoxicus]|uniref:Transposase n=1 Tax=Microcoleus anatoxicus PTRS2 TaxID=2705321 RepID=A0ABU8YS40_9CYAN
MVQDRGSIHTSKLVKERHAYWQSQGLYLLALPSYCSEMNRIENEWQRLKEYELAIAVMERVDARATQSGYEVQRYRFHSE